MIIFQNKGLIDMRAVTTMGVSVKSDSAIGYFGTGLKYAIAVLMRENQEMTIYRGEEKYEFTAKKEDIRGKEFELVLMNGQEMGFTTELGKNWKLWQAFRELYSNCKDEGGQAFREDDAELKEGFTTICVSGRKFEQVYDDKALYFVEGKPDIETPYCDIYLKPSSGVFYKGVNVLPGEQYANTYNLKRNIDLSEDRTALYDFQIKDGISRAVASCTDRGFIESILTAPQLSFEGNLNFDISGHEPSEEFITVCREMSQTFRRGANQNAIRYAKKHGSFEEPLKEFELNAVQESMYQRAIELLAKADFTVTEYPIVFVDTLGTMIHGEAKEGKILIAAEAFNQGTKELAITLLEEYWHLKYGFRDNTRAFQNHLFSQVGTLIERVNGEAF
jgi:hypothetical protein